jgi:hypothetical protein
MFNIYYNKCRDVTCVSICSIVPPLFDQFRPSSRNPLYALRDKRCWLRGNSYMHLILQLLERLFVHVYRSCDHFKTLATFIDTLL